MDIGHLLRATLTYRTRTGLGDRGDPTWSAAATCPARIDYRHGIVRGPGGEKLAYGVRIVTQVEIPVGARVWLPGADTASADAALTVLGADHAESIADGRTVYEAVL